MTTSRRSLILGLGASVLAAPACRGQAGPDTTNATAAPAGRNGRQARPLSVFGVDRFSRADQWSRLKRAAEAAGAEGFDLVADPDANYRHDGPLMLDGVSFDGRGCTLTALSDGPQALRCIGRGFRVANLRLLGAAGARGPDNWGNGLWIGDDNQPATDFVVEDVSTDRVAPGRGFAGSGLMFNNAHRGRIVRPTVRHSLSDGIHVTNGSSDLHFDHPLSENTGDDGFAVVSYVAHGRVCHDIRVVDGISRDSLARGFSVVGGRDIVLERPRAERSSAAGVYLYGEQHWNTYGVARCQVLDPVLVDCVTGLHFPAGFTNAALIVGGREGADMVGGETLSRGAVDCAVQRPVISGAGRACTAAISLHPHAVAPRIVGARLRNIISTNPAFPPNGIEIGGHDVVIDDPQMTDIAGLAILVGRTASGTCLVQAPRVTGSRLRPGAINSFVYVDQATGLRRMEVRNGVFTRGPDRLAISLVSDRLRLIGNTIG